MPYMYQSPLLRYRTLQRKQKTPLKQARARWRALQNIACPIIVTDDRDTIVFANRASRNITGTHHHRIIGQKGRSLIYPEDQLRYDSSHAKTTSKKNRSVQLRCINRSAEVVPVQVASMYDPRYGCTVSAFTDLTPIYQQQQQYERDRLNQSIWQKQETLHTIKTAQDEMLIYLSDLLCNPIMNIEHHHGRIEEQLKQLKRMAAPHHITEVLDTIQTAIRSANFALTQLSQALEHTNQRNNHTESAAPLAVRQDRSDFSALHTSKEQEDSLTTPRKKTKNQWLPEKFCNLSYRVLLVDDNAVVRLTMRKKFENSGFIVEEAKTGEEAVAAFHKQYFDIVFMDINMPGPYDGFGAVERIRQYELEHKITPSFISMLSSNQDKESKFSSKKCGANFYLTKPVKKQEFTQCLELAHKNKTQASRRRSVAHGLNTTSSWMAPYAGDNTANIRPTGSTHPDGQPQKEASSYVEGLLIQSRFDEAEQVIRHMRQKNWQQLRELIDVTQGNPATQTAKWF